MKKFLALALALVMICALSVTCFAATGITELPYNSGAQNVTVSYTGGVTAPATYVIDVTWDELSFTYNRSAIEWDATNHVEVEADSSQTGWVGATADITIVNHSNRAVYATVSYVAGTASGTASFALSNNAAESELAAAAGSNVAQKVVTLTASGVPATDADDTVVGTLTITVAKQATAAQ